MKKLTLEIEVEDEFEPGCCYGCPLSYIESDDYDFLPQCVLSANYKNCPFEGKDKDNE